MPILVDGKEFHYVERGKTRGFNAHVAFYHAGEMFQFRGPTRQQAKDAAKDADM